MASTTPSPMGSLLGVDRRSHNHYDAVKAESTMAHQLLPPRSPQPRSQAVYSRLPGAALGPWLRSGIVLPPAAAETARLQIAVIPPADLYHETVGARSGPTARKTASSPGSNSAPHSGQRDSVCPCRSYPHVPQRNPVLSCTTGRSKRKKLTNAEPKERGQPDGVAEARDPQHNNQHNHDQNPGDDCQQTPTHVNTQQRAAAIAAPAPPHRREEKAEPGYGAMAIGTFSV